MTYFFLISFIFTNHVFANTSEKNCIDLLNTESPKNISYRSRYPENPIGLIDRLTIIMNDTGLSQADLTRLLQFETNAKVSKIIRKNQVLLLHDIVILSHATGFSSWWLLTGEGDRYSSHAVESFFSNYNKEQFIKDWKIFFGNKLKTVMAEKGVNGRQIADYLGYDTGKISKVLTGNQELMPVAAINALRFLQVDYDSILNFPVKDPIGALSSEGDKSISDFDSESLIRELVKRGWEIYESPTLNSQTPGIILKFNH